MRRVLIVAAAIAVVVAAYFAWPFFGLHQLAQAVQSRDPQRIAQHADIAAIRESVAGQMFNEGIKGTKIGTRAGGLDAMLARQLVSPALEAIAAEMVTPEKLAELLDRDRAAQPGSGAAGGWSLRNPLDQLRSWYFQGPTTFVLYGGSGDRQQEWLRLKLRLDGLTWRLYDVLLPAGVRAQIAERVKGR